MQPIHTPSGLQFGPTHAGRMYLCANWHRGAGDGRHKSVWEVPPPDEYGIFCAAEDHNWQDDPGNYWGVKEGAPPLGRNDERVAKFPVPQNEQDPWHGYPVHSSEDRPPFSLIDLWCEQSLINTSLRKRLKKGLV